MSNICVLKYWNIVIHEQYKHIWSWHTTSTLTQSEDNLVEILNSGTFEKCAELQDNKNSLLKDTTAVANIKTSFAAEGQSINFV